MKLNQVQKLLQDTFNKEPTEGKQRHIVFWYDGESEFQDDIDEIQLANVRVLKLTDYNAFATKYEIEKADPHSHFLIYSNQPKPAARQNWLIDILKYSIEFTTDKMSIIMQDLGVKDSALRPVFKKYIKFFNQKGRYAKFASYDIQKWSEEAVDVAVLAALCKLPVLSLDEVLKTLFEDLETGSDQHWKAIQSFGDEETFWKLMEKHYGFQAETRDLKTLFMTLCLTHLSETIRGDLPDTWKRYISNTKTNCVVFVNQFMHHSRDGEVYDRLAEDAERQLRIKEYLTDWQTDDFIDCDTFSAFDRYLIQNIASHITENIQEFSHYRNMIAKRRKLHWYKHFQHEYEALEWAIQLFDTFEKIKPSLRPQKACDLFQSYTEQFYELDQAYRKFYLAYDQIQDADSFYDLKEHVEHSYVNGFLEELAIVWSDAVAEELTDEWALHDVNHQADFFRNDVLPYIQEDKRVFVIVSDAFRFEAGKELADQLNQERKASADLDVMQSVLPSYTALGMASLLPHKRIGWNESYDVEVNGQSTKGLENRNELLQAAVKDSVALSYDEIKGMRQTELRERIRGHGKKVIYIYHNVIDARGDHASTEREVFFAVEEAIAELKQLVNDLVNKLDATNILITADHGFIYQRSELQEYDKTSLKLADVGLEKRRFFITHHPEPSEGTLTISMDYLLGDGSGIYAIVPRGTNRFKRQGAGANFIHGGAMLQEVAVPVIKFKNDRSKSSKNEVKKVQVNLTSITRKITSMITYLEFFQKEKVEDKRRPLRLKLYFIDEEGGRISNENIVIADSTSSNPQDRTYKEKFVLKNMKYDKKKNYYLVLEDEDESVENIYEKIPFVIDVPIADDFGF